MSDKLQKPKPLIKTYQQWSDNNAYNVWVDHYIDISDFTKIDNVFVVNGSGMTDYVHDIRLIGWTTTRIHYQCRGLWSGGNSGVNAFVTVIGE